MVHSWITRYVPRLRRWSNGETPNIFQFKAGEESTCFLRRGIVFGGTESLLTWGSIERAQPSNLSLAQRDDLEPKLHNSESTQRRHRGDAGSLSADQSFQSSP